MHGITNREPGKWQVKIRTNQSHITKTFSTKAEAEQYLAQFENDGALSEDLKAVGQDDDTGPSP
jgi:hypothetical protein